MSLEEALERLQDQTLRKNRKRAEEDWKLSGRTILVLQLMDIPLRNVTPIISENMLPDMKETNFVEVWMADFTTIESFGKVELYAFKHPELSGPQNVIGKNKPYG